MHEVRWDKSRPIFSAILSSVGFMELLAKDERFLHAQSHRLTCRMPPEEKGTPLQVIHVCLAASRWRKALAGWGVCVCIRGLYWLLPWGILPQDARNKQWNHRWTGIWGEIEVGATPSAFCKHLHAHYPSCPSNPKQTPGFSVLESGLIANQAQWPKDKSMINAKYLWEANLSQGGTAAPNLPERIVF